MIMKKILVLLLGALLFSAELHAHPHVFVTYTYDVVASKEGMSKIRFHWRFDKMFTQMVLDELKLTAVTEKDAPRIKEAAFDNLKSTHFYLQMRVNEMEFKPQEVSDFSAKMDGGHIVYSFTVNLPALAKKLSIALLDEEFYTDLGPPMEPIGTVVGSALKEQDFKPKQFVTVFSDDGAAKPVCDQHTMPHESPMWGKMNVYAAVCVFK